jgi:predicted phosphodiesterase
VSRVLVLADLHKDFWGQEKRDPFAGNEDLLEGLEGVILAGDITNKPKVRWTPALMDVRRITGEVPTYVIPGNHDYYQYRFDAEDRLAHFAALGGAHFAQKTSVVFGDTRFLCATLWTDMELTLGREGQDWGRPQNEEFLGREMNDYRVIRIARSGFGPLRPSHTIQAHRDHRRWLEEELAKPWDGRTVMVTHHAPHPDVLRTDISHAAAYASDLSAIFEGPHAPDLALHGHSHDAEPTHVGRTPIQSVSLGYPDQLKNEDEIRRRLERAIIEVGPAPAPRP